MQNDLNKKTAQPIILLMIASNSKTLSTTEKQLKSGINYFISQVKEVNGKQIPSTPYFDKFKNPIFIGDIVEIAFKSEGEIWKEIHLVNLLNGEYVTIDRNSEYPTPLYLHNPKSIKVIGNAEQQPELLKELTD